MRLFLLIHQWLYHKLGYSEIEIKAYKSGYDDGYDDAKRECEDDD
jgi:hypothetical protein